MLTGDLIREARLRAGLTQSELGERLGAHPTAISRWERGLVRPPLETLRQVVKACGLELTLGLANADPDAHDAAMIKRSLRLTPAERLQAGIAEHRAIERMAAQAAGARRG